MLLTAHLKLLVMDEQRPLLLDYMERSNQASNKVSAIAFRDKNWNKFKLRKQCYYGIREEFGLSAQTTILVTRKVADSYRTDIENIRIRNKIRPKDEPKEELKQHKFKKHGAVSYDARCMSWKGRDKVSILTLEGRILIPIVLSGKYADLELTKVRGEADLLYRKGIFYLAVTYEVAEPPLMVASDLIGVDLGRKNIAFTSDGEMFCGDTCERNRKRYVGLRKRYQSVGSKSAQKYLSKIDRKEANFKKNENHHISKELVSQAKGTGRGIALEELTYIPRPRTAAKDQRDAGSKWAFRQLRQFIEYKAAMSGVPVVFVNPAYTSQKCSICGHIDEDNRQSQSSFVCLRCGHSEHADLNASKNIRDMARAAVNQPMVVRHAVMA